MQTELNLYRQAKQLLDKEDAGRNLTDDENTLVNTAMIPLLAGRFPDSMTISEGLEELATMFKEL